MKNTARLLIALGFAAFAAILNFLWVQQNLPKYRDYTVYTEDFAQGSIIESSEESFRPVSLPKKSGKLNLSEFFVPWEERSSLVGFRTSRSIQSGELALIGDVTAKNITPDFGTLGPFRLLSVRDQFVNRNSSESQRSSGGVVGRIPVTLVVARQVDSRTGMLTYEPKVKQLLHILEMDKKAVSDRRETSVMAIVAMSGSSSGDSSMDDGPELKSNEVALVIDLPDIPIITDVLLKNTSPEIGFVVPASLIEALK